MLLPRAHRCAVGSVCLSAPETGYPREGASDPSGGQQRGFLGVVISCPDCEEDHFFGWSLLRENLEHILQHGEPRVHEPAFEPAVDHYVTWDYAKGFVDGLLEGEHEHGPLRDGWTSPAEAARRLRRALATRGLSEDEVAAVLSEGGLPAADPGDR